MLIPTFDMMDGDALWDHDTGRISWAADGVRFAVSAAQSDGRRTHIAAYDASSDREPQRLLEPFDAHARTRTPAARLATDQAIVRLLDLPPSTDP